MKRNVYAQHDRAATPTLPLKGQRKNRKRKKKVQERQRQALKTLYNSSTRTLHGQASPEHLMLVFVDSYNKLKLKIDIWKLKTITWKRSVLNR